MNLSGVCLGILLGIFGISIELVSSQGCITECGGGLSCLLPYNCTHFDQCHSTDAGCSCTRLMCSFGTFFSAASGVCDTVSKGLCDEDPCLQKQRDYTYPSNFNCRSFYQCNNKGRSVPMCCRDFYRYDYELQECTPDVSCNISCNQREGQEYYNLSADQLMATDPYECFFRPISGKPNKYYNEVAKIEQDCADSTFYNPEKCGCDMIAAPAGTLRAPRCRPLLHVDFANDTVINLRRDVYINAQNTDIQASGMEGVQYGLFNGRNSFIEIPYLSGIALDKFFIRLRFYSAAGGGAEDQVLFSNCESTISRTAADTSELPQVYQRPSMAVILNKPSRLLTFIAQTDTSPKTIIRLPFLDEGWNNVEMVYDGKALTARIRSVSPDGTGVEEKDTKILSGRLLASKFTPRIGVCMTERDAFFGYLDMVKMYDCIPADLPMM